MASDWHVAMNDSASAELPGTQPAQSKWLWLRIGATLVALVLVVVLFSLWPGGKRIVAPAEGSAEVGFARDMAMHHAQAVNLAMLLRDRSDDEEMRQLALDILLTQQAQIGMMQGWLAVWGLPYASLEPAMAWMGMPTTDRMPGMASAAEINQLQTLTGPAADTLFIQLMIPHHRSGVDMAQAVLARSERPEVRALAQAIVNAQQSEISYMEELLARKGGQPAPDEPAMNHEHMNP